MSVRPDPGRSVAAIGAGPAGLMAAEAAGNAGARADVYDATPSVGRTLLIHPGDHTAHRGAAGAKAVHRVGGIFITE